MTNTQPLPGLEAAAREVTGRDPSIIRTMATRSVCDYREALISAIAATKLGWCPPARWQIIGGAGDDCECAFDTWAFGPDLYGTAGVVVCQACTVHDFQARFGGVA